MKLTSKTYAKEILNNIDKKKIIVLKRDKNDCFIIKYGLSQKDIEDIVYGLTDNLFKEKIINLDKRIKTEYLYVFKAVIELNDEYGFLSNYIYIKICEIRENILVVSLHEDE